LIGQLEIFRANVSNYSEVLRQASSQGSTMMMKETARKMRPTARAEAYRLLDVAQRVIDEVLPDRPEWVMENPEDRESALDWAARAIGVIQTKTELDRRLAPAGPRLRAADLHPLIWQSAAKIWADGHYRAAVQGATAFLNTYVQELVDRRDLSDAGLMQQVFSSDRPKEGQPRLRWPGDPSALTVKSMNDGLRNFALGVFLAIRNPVTHDKTELPEQDALEQLAALSLLARWIDGCQVATAEGAS
jgi:uncharacterized protein (TIGR02391 family)